MEKFWKSVAMGSVLLLVLTIGISMVMAQEDQDPSPPVVPDLGEEDGAEHCDGCGPVPDGDSDHREMGGWHSPGEMMEGMMPRGGHGMRGSWGESEMMDHHGGRGMHGSSLISILADNLGMTVEEIVDELSAGISIADLANAHGVNVQDIVDAHLAEREAFLNDAIEAGRMTQEQAQEMLDQMAEEIAEHINEPWTGEHGPSMRGSWGEAGMMDHHGGRGMHGSSLISILADELSMSVEEIVDELSAGISIADLASAHSVDVQDIVDAHLAEREAFLNDAVEASRMTQEQAQEMLDQMAERIAEHIEEPWTGEHGPGMGHLNGFGHHEGGVPQGDLDQGLDSNTNL